MSAIEAINAAKEVIGLIGTLSELASKAIAAATSPEPKRVQEILPPQLQTSIAKLRAELEAHEKFGPRA